MDINAHRLLCDNIQDFKATANLVESEIRRLGIRNDSEKEVPDTNGRKHRDMWTSMKTVSHFNLGIALELMLKFILHLAGITPVKVLQGKELHFLTKLHDALPESHQKQLECEFQRSRRELPDGVTLIAYMNSALPEPPDSPQNRDISSLRGFLEYFDEDMKLWQKRYTWELVASGCWRHYISDISVFVRLIDRVMDSIRKEERLQRVSRTSGGLAPGRSPLS